MGEGGEIFGLALYLDKDGLRWLLDRMQGISIDLYSRYSQDYIAVTFENANELDDKEKELVLKTWSSIQG